MPSVTYIHSDGRSETVDARDGDSAMITAMQSGVDGIVGECGGGLVCATCHVYVDDSWMERVGTAAADEDEMLEGVAAERSPNSRLSCQIKMSDALDGLVLRLPDRQF
ncbi:2Fe-2S iron-sulfur cluster binding domain-containing protein [Tardiphaga sp. vice352]|uniref:2Fe-2S iron-sulfur cluster-binding protein n=1 Tax=unclassified Tardiphaga TaxID=2631404 RepID=UPI001164DF15|nr:MULTISPECIES: 2Fe-2S iron-sulfur cluster-binding protein [unclassified Tardiphaga]QDM15874.1 2Fe-2S iron-sulfur cluster binding domain-containing protein [Tardiphaga sp. vice278]QDM20974.1 2Fe-2S iron-sulfur cluster binding domain-containing protein [Tardiphaga sp. vice154]QDM26068.1 2Fe-2S iron-sulfur cluster binding domain-containing protein [Tardiphaga sp. vice304]QDM31219.1 2Fe-2S iron-sulfur cluster binding domain-containing protein [Tardiphaga sp. vice352]